MAEVHSVLSKAQLRLGNHAEALKHIDLAIRADPSDPALLLEKAKVAVASSNPQLAVQALDLAIRANPNFPLFYYARGWARTAQNDHKGAVADYTKALGIAKDAHILLARAVAYFQQGATSLGESDLDEALKANARGMSPIRVTLEIAWIRYLYEIQKAGDTSNWSKRPLDSYERALFAIG